MRPLATAENLAKIEALAKNQSKINGLLAPVAGMGYLRTEIYNFVNTQSKAKQLDMINTDAFLAFEQKTPAKAAKIAAHSEQHPGVMDVMFELVREIMAAKDESDTLASTPLVPKKSGNPLMPVIAVVVLVPALCYAVMDFVIIPKIKTSLGAPGRRRKARF